MGAFVQNVRYGVRLLGRNPGFTAAAVACLALGIGATTAIFSVVNAVLLKPLPYTQSSRLTRIFTEFPTFPNGGLRHFWVSPPEYFDLKRDTRSFSRIEAWANQGANLAGTAEPVRATVSYVTGGMLPMLGITPVLGRLLSSDDDRPNVPQTAVLSYGLWQRAYAGDRGVIGRDIRLNGSACTVVGVMPPSFAFPPGELDPPELWAPLQLDPARPGGRGSHFLNVLAQRGPGVTPAHAEAEMASYVRQTGLTAGRGTHQFDPKFHPIVLAGFQDEIVRPVRRAMLVLLGSVVFVLLIACVNVANLLLARVRIAPPRNRGARGHRRRILGGCSNNSSSREFSSRWPAPRSECCWLSADCASSCPPTPAASRARPRSASTGRCCSSPWRFRSSPASCSVSRRSCTRARAPCMRL